MSLVEFSLHSYRLGPYPVGRNRCIHVITGTVLMRDPEPRLPSGYLPLGNDRNWPQPAQAPRTVELNFTEPLPVMYRFMHGIAQNLVQTRLIAIALILEPLQHIGIDAHC